MHLALATAFATASRLGAPPIMQFKLPDILPKGLPNLFDSGAEQVSERVKGLTFEAADVATLPEVSSFFVDAFWLASTTFEGIELSANDRRQLQQKVAEDLGPRYGIQTKDKSKTLLGGRQRKGFPGRSLFESRLIVAREADGAIVGCAGIEAALYETETGQVFRSDQADKLVREELNAMSNDEAKRASEVYAATGIGGLAKGVINKEFSATLKQPYLSIWSPASVLANLAVGASYRRSGLGRALCDACVACTTDEWDLDEIVLQVEEGNTAAVSLYRKDGYRQVFRAEDATALRLIPSESSLFDGLPGPFSALAPQNEKLLKELASPTLTMAKRLR